MPSVAVGGDPNLPEMPELIDQARHGPMTGRAGRLAGPGQRADRGSGMVVEQRVQHGALFRRQGAAQLGRGMAFRLQESGGHHAFDGGGSRRGDAAPLQLRHQRFGDMDRADRRQGDRHQPR